MVGTVVRSKKREWMPMRNPRVFFFGAGEYLGLSLLYDGKNLPQLSRRWILLGEAELSPELLSGLPLNAEDVVSGLVNRGYHLEKQSTASRRPACHRTSA